MPFASITGDVHHHIGYSFTKKEHLLAERYAQIIREHEAKATLFVTGKCIERERDFWIKLLSTHNHIELGGHTYSALKPDILHSVFKQFFNSRYGPYFYQYADISKTTNALKKLGIAPMSWRTHSYQGDANTFQILQKLGFTVVSDLIMPGQLRILKVGSLYHIPVNVRPDDAIYIHLLKGDYPQVKVEGRRIKEGIHNSILRGHDIVAQLHPSSMKLLDDFNTLTEILDMLRQHNYTFIKLSETPQLCGTIEDVGALTRLSQGYTPISEGLPF